MIAEVEFYGLNISASIDGNATFDSGKFIRDTTYFNVDEAGQRYPGVKGIQVTINVRSNAIENTILRQALIFTEEILTVLCASSQTDAYLSKPITCKYKDKVYVLDGAWFHDADSHVMNGGKAFVVNLDYLNEPKNPPRILHLYRAAKDATLTTEWRLLNAWRFLEAFHGCRDRNLILHLVNHHHVVQVTAERYYEKYRCAAAHATTLHNNPNSASVIAPRAMENVFDGELDVDLHMMLEYIDEDVRLIEDFYADKINCGVN
ncbi:MAG TPA: hypothetical protein VMR34_05395 [Candidatus Saccharimonadales bacterium]|nr:hypothetical protein [Candidatus Saccharimonadales bacterium]